MIPTLLTIIWLWPLHLTLHYCGPTNITVSVNPLFVSLFCCINYMSVFVWSYIWFLFPPLCHRATGFWRLRGWTTWLSSMNFISVIMAWRRLKVLRIVWVHHCLIFSHSSLFVFPHSFHYCVLFFLFHHNCTYIFSYPTIIVWTFVYIPPSLCR